MAYGGRVVIVGNRGRIEIDPRKVMSKDGAIVGMALWNTKPEDLTRIYRALDAGLENGALAPVVGTELPLADAKRAHELVLEPGAKGQDRARRRKPTSRARQLLVDHGLELLERLRPDYRRGH